MPQQPSDEDILAYLSGERDEPDFDPEADGIRERIQTWKGLIDDLDEAGRLEQEHAKHLVLSEFAHEKIRVAARAEPPTGSRIRWRGVLGGFVSGALAAGLAVAVLLRPDYYSASPPPLPKAAPPERVDSFGGRGPASVVEQPPPEIMRAQEEQTEAIQSQASRDYWSSPNAKKITLGNESVPARQSGAAKELDERLRALQREQEMQREAMEAELSQSYGFAPDGKQKSRAEILQLRGEAAIDREIEHLEMEQEIERELSASGSMMQVPVERDPAPVWMADPPTKPERTDLLHTAPEGSIYALHFELSEERFAELKAVYAKTMELLDQAEDVRLRYSELADAIETKTVLAPLKVLVDQLAEKEQVVRRAAVARNYSVKTLSSTAAELKAHHKKWQEPYAEALELLVALEGAALLETPESENNE